jgi:Flp pilus assembly protein CpaB
LASQAPAARPRPGGGRLFIIVGLLVALLAGAGVFLLGGTLSSGVGGGGGGGNIVVVVAKQNISLRHQITSADLTTVNGSGSYLSINSYQHTSDVLNKIAEVSIKQGSIITSDMLATDIGLINTSNLSPAYLPLASGYVALTVPTSEQQGVAGHITIGDYITVIASAQTTLFATGPAGGASAPRAVTKTVFWNIRIIGVGPAQIQVQPAAGASSANTAPPTTGGVTSSLTIEMTQCDAEYMVWFLNNTQLRYTLESFNDYLKSPPTQPDTACPTIQSAGGVSNKDIDAKFHFTTA